jgi:hypothetical protein
MIKSIVLALTLAALLTPVTANAKPNDRGDRRDRNDKGCNNKGKGCSTPVPEPGDFMLLSSGLATLGGLSFVRRKFLNR